MEGVRNRKCVAMHKDVGAIHESTENVGTGGLISIRSRNGSCIINAIHYRSAASLPRRSEKKHHIKHKLCFTDNKVDRRGRRSLQNLLFFSSWLYLLSTGERIKKAPIKREQEIDIVQRVTVPRYSLKRIYPLPAPDKLVCRSSVGICDLDSVALATEPSSNQRVAAPEKPKPPAKSRGFSGAATQIRTGDLILTKDVLYQLSHSSKSQEYFLVTLTIIAKISWFVNTFVKFILRNLYFWCKKSRNA